MYNNDVKPKIKPKKKEKIKKEMLLLDIQYSL